MHEFLQDKPLLAQILAGSCSAILVAVLIYVTRRYILNRVRVRRITSRDSYLAEQTLDLYARIFPNEDGTDYTREDMLEIMDEQFVGDKHVHSENIILVAEQGGTVLGFIFAHYYRSYRKCIISYYATTPDDSHAAARAISSSRLLNRLRRILRARHCSHLFFDLQGDHAFSDEHARRHRSRAKAFAQRARQHGLTSLMCKFDYISPKLSLDADYKESRCSLHFIPLNGEPATAVPKDEMIRHLEFVYYCCYGDIYDMTDPRFRAYHSHLESLVKRYRKVLPDQVPVSEP